MTNKQMNGNEFFAFINSEKLYLLDILKVRIFKKKIAVAYANFYESYLSDSIVFEEVMNKKENFKTWFFKSGTNEIFVVDSDSVDEFLESQGTNKLIFIQEVNVNKVFGLFFNLKKNKVLNRWMKLRLLILSKAV